MTTLVEELGQTDQHQRFPIAAAYEQDQEHANRTHLLMAAIKVGGKRLQRVKSVFAVLRRA